MPPKTRPKFAPIIMLCSRSATTIRDASSDRHANFHERTGNLISDEHRWTARHPAQAATTTDGVRARRSVQILRMAWRSKGWNTMTRALQSTQDLEQPCRPQNVGHRSVHLAYAVRRQTGSGNCSGRLGAPARAVTEMTAADARRLRRCEGPAAVNCTTRGLRRHDE